MVPHDWAPGGVRDHYASGISLNGTAMISHHGGWPAPQVLRACGDPRITRFGGRDTVTAQEHEGQYSTKPGSIGLRHFRYPLKRHCTIQPYTEGYRANVRSVTETRANGSPPPKNL